MKRWKVTALRIVQGEIVSSASTTSSAGAASARTVKRGRTVHTASAEREQQHERVRARQAG